MRLDALVKKAETAFAISVGDPSPFRGDGEWIVSTRPHQTLAATLLPPRLLPGAQGAQAVSGPGTLAPTESSGGTILRRMIPVARHLRSLDWGRGPGVGGGQRHAVLSANCKRSVSTRHSSKWDRALCMRLSGYTLSRYMSPFAVACLLICLPTVEVLRSGGAGLGQALRRTRRPCRFNPR